MLSEIVYKMKKTLLSCAVILSLGVLTVNIGCSSEPETGSDYVPPADQSPEEEGDIEGADEESSE
mgnify:CR=1 FL=1|tara:strand:+ start:765 stop:959 length:195 start_codon:yes stop_codon:yes gene_type:complete